MSNWQLIKELAKSTSIYKKQFSLFVAIILSCLSLYGLNTYHSYLSADPLSSSDSDATSGAQTIYLHITKDGRIFKDGHVVDTVELGKEADIVRYKVIDSPGVFIDSFTVIALFESRIDDPNVIYEVKSAHSDTGYSVNTSAAMTDAHTIIFSGQNLGPESLFTVYAKLPNGIITPPWWRSSAFDVTSLSLIIWIIIGLLLPLLTLVFLGIMLAKRWLYNKGGVKQAIDSPPENISPAIVGVLMHGRIGPREISSTLIDLAQRGYIYIFQDNHNFSFGRGHALESEQIFELKSYEKIVLSKIFENNSATNNLHDINLKLNQSLFSQKMAQVFLEIYKEVNALGYFQQNPGLTHQKYKISGMTLFFLSALGFILNVVFNHTFPFLIFFWVGMMISATLIMYFAPRMPILTPKGRAARQAWMNFRDYLIMTKTNNFQEVNQSPYTKYLPYAIALNAETNWTRHFFDVPFSRPNWFDSNPPTATIEDFANNLFPLIAYASTNLIVSRTPVID